jgi:excinuclease UvrABC ATPase subunit
MIRIRNAHIHNLKNIDLDIPKGKLTVITGVSGSGKSSLAFDTIYEEGKRRYLQYVGSVLQMDDPPSFDEISGLSPTLAVEQRIIRQNNPRSTVGTRTKINNLLQVLFSAAGTFPCPACGGQVDGSRVCDRCGEVQPPYSSSFYSRNSAVGFCFSCLGTGYRAEIDEQLACKNPDTPMKEVLQVTPNIFRALIPTLPDFYHAYGVQPTDPFGSLTQEAREAFLYGSPLTRFEGLVPYIRRSPYIMKPVSSKMPALVRAGLGRLIACPDCGGAGLGCIPRLVTAILANWANSRSRIYASSWKIVCIITRSEKSMLISSRPSIRAWPFWKKWAWATCPCLVPRRRSAAESCSACSWPRT